VPEPVAVGKAPTSDSVVSVASRPACTLVVGATDHLVLATIVGEHSLAFIHIHNAVGLANTTA